MANKPLNTAILDRAIIFAVRAHTGTEHRGLVNSPAVATYDLQPEMSAYELKDRLIEAINTNRYDWIVVNFANADVAPTILHIMGLQQPQEMTGQCLINE